MKTRPTIFDSLALAICLAIPAWAQQTSGTSAPSPSSSLAGISPVKIAVIETEAFYDTAKGITRMIRVMEGLDQEFEPLNKELQGAQQRYQSLVAEIDKAAPATDPKALQGKRFQAESLRRELKNKAEDAEQTFMKRLRQVLDPIEDDLQKAIASYAEQRGISLVFDLNRARDVIIYVAESANVTRDFIDDYNRRTSSATPPAKTSGN